MLISWLCILLMSSSPVKGEIFPLEQKGRSEKQPTITFFIRMPQTWVEDDENSRVRGVLAYCTWDGDANKVEQGLSSKKGKFPHLWKLADEHNLAIVTWTTKGLHSRNQSYFEISDEEQKQFDRAFDDVADTWERGYKRLAHKYELPLENVLLFGMSGGAQYAHRLVLRRPEYFAAVHIHINSSYDKPVPKGKEVLWLVTTGELEHGYDAAKRFYRDCIEMGYHVVFKAGENLGHAGRQDIYLLGAEFFKFNLTFIPDYGNPEWEKPPVEAEYFMRYPAYVGDLLNHQVFPVDRAKYILPENLVSLPVKNVAEAWGPVFE